MASYSAWFVGEGSLLIQAAETWLGSGHEVLGIATREPKVMAWGKDRGLRLIDPGALREPLTSAGYDFLFSVVNLTMLEDDLIKTPRKLAINFHDGPLPRYAGVNTPVWALVNGETDYGIT